MSRAYDPTIASSDIVQLSWELGLAQILSGGASELVIGRSQVLPMLGEPDFLPIPSTIYSPGLRHNITFFQMCFFITKFSLGYKHHAR